MRRLVCSSGNFDRNEPKAQRGFETLLGFVIWASSHGKFTHIVCLLTKNPSKVWQTGIRNGPLSICYGYDLSWKR